MVRAGIFIRNQLAVLGVRCLLDAEADIEVAFATGTPFAVPRSTVWSWTWACSTSCPSPPAGRPGCPPPGRSC
nr:hypothetical protein [Streptomyces sp. RPA4-2]QIY63575.1 hypothetical protein HEP85_20590 [Streptomyces sp. RPA4-2]